MLALLLLVYHAVATDLPKDTNYVTKHISSCPDEGFFFQREVAPNAIDPRCYLCFCQDDSSATCWLRENRRCDLKSYHIGKRETRVRRSPLSLGELFVRDAAREFFNKQSPEQCKPYESSFSDGCPPADWCIGCTVCDCDANGRWDCHVLSFCPDKNGKKQMKKQKAPVRSRMSKRRAKTKTSVVPQSTKNVPNTTKKPAIRRNYRRNQLKQSNTKHKIDPVKGTKVKKITPVKKSKPKLHVTKSVPGNKVTKNPLIIKKTVPTNKPLDIKQGRVKLKQNNTIEVAQKVVKQFMTTMQKMMKNFEKKANTTSKPSDNKIVNKRSMSKQDTKKYAKNVEDKYMFRAKRIEKAMMKRKEQKRKMKSNKKSNRTHHSRNYGRNKRQLAINEIISNFNYSNSFKENVSNPQDVEKNKTDNNFTSNFTNYTLNITNDQKDTYAVYPILMKTDEDVIPIDYNISKTEDSLMNNGSNFKDTNNLSNFNNINNLTSPHYDTYDVNTTESPAIWLFDNTSTPFDKNYYEYIPTTNFRHVLTSSTNISNFTTRLIPHTTRSDLVEPKPEINNLNETVISERIKSNTNITQESDYKENVDHTCKFRTLLEKLIKGDADNKTRTLKKLKRYTILSKIKRLFKKIFHKSPKGHSYYNGHLHFDRYEATRSDYKKSVHCILHPKEKIKLRQKIEELRTESETILKTINIIKGLLQILEINTNDTRAKLKYNDYNENIAKLDAIIQDTYKKENFFKKLSNDQRTQINYIKENVHVFIKSMGNFARILEEIIQIVKYHNKNHYKVSDNLRSNKDNYRFIVEDKSKDTTKEKLEKLKKMLINYNILQNTFVHQIYNVLSNIETNTTLKEHSKSELRGNRYLKINETDVIDANSVNIIKNIKKLKVLADKLNVHSRKKRKALGDEDALEYLVILMEYLLRRHVTTSSPPINDGIDLLIEAIKSAPDIKPIQKKVLEHMPLRTLVTRTTPINPVTEVTTYNNLKAKEDNRLIQAENNTVESTEPNQADEDDEDEEEYEKNYQKFRSGTDSNSKIDQQQDASLEQAVSPSHKNIDSGSEDKSKDNEVLGNKAVGDDFNTIVFTSPSTPDAQLQITTEYSVTQRTNFKKAEIHNSVGNPTEIEKIDDNFLVDTKANTDWIEENFKEVKQFGETEQISTTHKSVTRTNKSKLKNTDNLSDVTKELDADKKKLSKTSAESRPSKKQKDLLNLQDYGVDKDIEDEIDSREDKFLSDTY